jgi:hypothetical protein
LTQEREREREGKRERERGRGKEGRMKETALCGAGMSDQTERTQRLLESNVNLKLIS